MQVPLAEVSATHDGTELLGDWHSCLHHLAGVSMLLLQRLALIKQKVALHQCTVHQQSSDCTILPGVNPQESSLCIKIYV